MVKLPEKVFRYVDPKSAEVQHTVPSEPVKSLQVEDVQEVVNNALVHPFRALEQIVQLQNVQEKLLKELILDNLIKRQVHDDTAQLGLTLNYHLRYHRHTYVYAYSNTGFTLAVSNGASMNVPANYWTLVNYPDGSSLTVLNGSDTVPILCTFRACDVPMQNATALTQQANNNISVPSSAGNTVIKGSPGILASITITTAGTGAGNVQIFDNATTNSGTVLYAFPATITVPNNFIINMPAKNGITAQNVLNGPVFTVGFL